MQKVRILAIDPGLMNLGWSVIDYNLNDNTKTILKYDTISGKTLLKSQKNLQAEFENRHLIVWELEPALIEIFTIYKPDYIVVEEPFAHIYIQAYAALVMVVQTVRTASKKVFTKDIFLIAPKEAKKAISSDGTSGKEAVQEAIKKDKSILLDETQLVDIPLTEHACDSIAVGIAFIQNQLPAVIASR